MDPEANSNKGKKTYHNHTCPRHHDLTILLHAANKKICNSCFATLKKSYFNVIAGLLLEEHYLHNVTRGLVEQNNSLQKQIQDQQQHLLNLTHEIAEIKNNGRNDEKVRDQNQSSTSHNPPQNAESKPPQDAKIIRAEGHVAQVAHSLQDLLHVQIDRVLASWQRKKARTHPKSDDLQDKSISTHPHPENGS